MCILWGPLIVHSVISLGVLAPDHMCALFSEWQRIEHTMCGNVDLDDFVIDFDAP